MVRRITTVFDVPSCRCAFAGRVPPIDAVVAACNRPLGSGNAGGVATRAAAFLRWLWYVHPAVLLAGRSHEPTGDQRQVSAVLFVSQDNSLPSRAAHRLMREWQRGACEADVARQRSGVWLSSPEAWLSRMTASVSSRRTRSRLYPARWRGHSLVPAS